MTKDQTSKKKANHKHTEGSDENDSKNTTKQKLEDLLINFIDDQFEEKNKILLNYPDNPFLLLFKTYYSLYNTNDCEKLLKLVQTISKYVKDCHKANYILERNSTKEFRNNLSNQRKEITALLYEFTPESTRAKQPSADFVRVCKTMPSTLKEIVDFIHSRIKFYRASTKD